MRPLLSRNLLLLLTLVALVALTTSGCFPGAPAISYSDFLAEVQGGNVENVELFDDRAVVRLKRPLPGVEPQTMEYRVQLPPADVHREELIELLVDQEVSFAYHEP